MDNKTIIHANSCIIENEIKQFTWTPSEKVCLKKLKQLAFGNEEDNYINIRTDY